VLPALAKAARTLGPKGLMPNPKRGSVTAEIGDAVRRAKGGEVTFAANKHAVVHSTIGRVRFTTEELRENILELL